jgi:hypothetical protein
MLDMTKTYNILVRKMKIRDHFRDLSVDGRVISVKEISSENSLEMVYHNVKRMEI